MELRKSCENVRIFQENSAGLVKQKQSYEETKTLLSLNTSFSINPMRYFPDKYLFQKNIYIRNVEHN